MLLEAVYEQDFLDCSYGFRRQRSAHDALQALWNAATRTAGGWVLEIDVRKFFDSMDHGHIRAILRKRVLDGVLLRLIDKWLHAGILEDGHVSYPDSGSPQGGVVSPIIANIFLHEVLDTWFDREIRPRLSGSATLIRYADDAVLFFERERDAQRVLDLLPERFGKFGLALHPAKTRLVEFKRPDFRGEVVRDQTRPRPGTFDFLGFTHCWCLSRAGKWTIRRSTARDRFRRALRTVTEWCRRNRHLDVRIQHEALSRKLRGHYGYYGVNWNYPLLKMFRYKVTMAWWGSLASRSQRSRLSWERMARLLKRYPLPLALTRWTVQHRAANP
jgi:group II intron reverse transcriptase/maturase